MDKYRYIIVGGGMTASAACQGIREQDAEGSILVIAQEEHEPYQRPPLSKGLWKGDAEDSIWYHNDELGIDLRRGHRVTSLNLDKRSVTDDDGETFGYDKLLLATGGQPRHLPFGGDDIIYFRTLNDYRSLRALVDAGKKRVCVIGGGFIGSEVAAGLAMNDCAVTMAFPEPGICARVFPHDLSVVLNDYYRGRGVDVLAETAVTGVERKGDVIHVALKDGRTIEADAVVAGIGIIPDASIAEAAGLPVDNGIIVDSYGRVGNRKDVFAAGDVARFPDAVLGVERRVEHEDHANEHGKQVGANMAGANRPYQHLPFFYSDLFDVGYEAVGELDARMTTQLDWNGLEGEGTITYLDEERHPRGMLLWNRFGHVEEATETIRAAKPVPTTTHA